MSSGPMDTATMVEYVLGQLEDARARELEERLERDPALAEECAALAEVFAGLTEPSPDAGPELRERIVASAAPGRRFDGFARRLARLFDLDEDGVEALLLRAVEGPSRDWLPYAVPGAHVLPVACGPALGGALGALVYLDEGVNLPRHRHGGLEQMLVLEGYARELLEGERRFVGPGDLLISEAGSAHEFEILRRAPCLFACTAKGELEWLRD